MADEDWQKVREIFDSAVDFEPEERRKFVRNACGGNKALLTEVESLFASLGSADGFMETPAIADVASIIEAQERFLETGTFLGHYEIVERIGVGGMGEVYLAKDHSLDRLVALKILNDKFSQDEANLHRFVSEAKAASALNHPNILVIHEIDIHEQTRFIVSEFINGKTLRETLGTDTLHFTDALEISTQIASALCSAHEAGLVHRDIKPENIMIRPDGLVKVLDFGLAKLVEPENPMSFGSKHDTGDRNQTAEGLILGTVNYMSPEQAKAEQVDQRTDIFSLGVVMYEMMAGTTPFAGDSLSETVANLLTFEPEPLPADIPAGMQQIITKALRKGKADRYGTMNEVFRDLKKLRDILAHDQKMMSPRALQTNIASKGWRAITGRANIKARETHMGITPEIGQNKRLVAVIFGSFLIGTLGLGYYFYPPRSALTDGGLRSIAVLPFHPISATNRDDIYEIGIADSLILKIGSMKGLIVRPLSATRIYADIGQDPIAAGREQKVDYVLASNYQLSGGKIRVTSQLFNVANGQMEESYKSGEKDAANVFELQDDIAAECGNILLKRFAATSDIRTAKRGTASQEAYRLFLQGMFLLDKNEPAEARKAVDIFRAAVELDPNYAQAWSGTALAHRTLANRGRSADTLQEYKSSIEAINKALALDPDLSDAHSALCENKMYFEWDLSGAERECMRAIELDPNSALAHQVYTRYLVGSRRFDEALAEIKIAVDLEPASLFTQRVYGNTLYYSRRYAEAATQLKRVVAMDPNFAIAYPWLWQSLEMQGNFAEAYEWFMKFQVVQKSDDATVQLYMKAYQSLGWRGILLEQARLFDESNLVFFHGAIISAKLGNTEKAFEYLDRSYQRRELWMSMLNTEPGLDSLRGDPRFDELVRRVGLR